MYSRSFFTDEKSAPTPPENYSGIAIGEEEKPCEEQCVGATVKFDELGNSCEQEKSEGVFGLFSGKKPLASLFGGGGLKSLISGIGIEEILIIATAVFLLLSKEGDKECAVMLLLLLIV